MQPVAHGNASLVRRDAEVLASLIRATSEEWDIGTTATVVAEAAASLVPGARWASVGRGVRDHLITWAATADTARDMDAAQHRAGAGPSLSALFDDRTVCVSADLPADDRWPALGPQADTTGVRGVLAARLAIDVDHGFPYVVTLYTDEAGVFDEIDVLEGIERCVAFIGLAVTAVVSRAQAQHLSRALESNLEIGVGMGVLMANHRITRDQAFDLLRTASQNGNRKLRDIASEVADTGTLDLPPHRPCRPARAASARPQTGRPA